MKLALQLIFIAGIFALTGCGPEDSEITSLSQLKGGRTFAVPTGTAADQMVLKHFPDAKIEYYNTVLDCALAVQGGKADATSYDLPVLKNIVGKNPGLAVLPELMTPDQYGFAVQLENKALKQAIDQTLEELKTNGTYEDMMKRWFPPSGSPAPMPVIETDGAKGVLKFGTAAVTEPMSFVDANHNVAGFDVEFAYRIAKKLGRKLEIVDMEFGAMLPALISGKVDMIGAGLSITEERAKKVLFSECYYPSGIAVVVRGKSGDASKDATAGRLRSADDIKDKKMGVLMGSIYDSYAMRNYPKAEIMQFNNVTDCLTAINTNKIDVMFCDDVSVPEVLSKHPDLGILVKNLFVVDIAAGFNKESVQLREQFNAFLKQIKSNGVYDDMVKRWMERGGEAMPAIHGAKTNGKLNVGVVSDLGFPFSMVRNGKLEGFDIELSSRFAASIGMEFVPVNMHFGSLIAAISTKKIDIITASMMVTDERKKQIDFSDAYFVSGGDVLARKERMDPAISGAQGSQAVRKPFLERVVDSFNSNIMHEKRYLLIIDGLLVTIIISLLSAVFGTIFGALVCAMRMSKRKALSATAGAYITLLRGTPVLVLLMIIYYIVFSSININPVLVAVIAFGLNFAAYVSEMFRTSIESIDRGQTEAGIAGGFTRVQTFVHIVAPQATRHLLPVYKGEFISMVKMTSIVGYIAVQDLTKAGDIIRSRTFDAFFPLIMVAVIYLLLAWLLTWALSRIEVSVDPEHKRVGNKTAVTR
jgi:polar amino acid transport system substrate-binding protein